MAEIEKHIEEKDRVVALIRTSRKRLVSHGFKPKVIDFALRLRKDEDDTMIEQRRAEIEVARFLNHPIGTQPELPLVMEDRTPGVDKAFAEGEIAGASGKTCSAPYATASANEQSWIRGWHEGQATITSAFKKLEAKAAAEAEAGADEIDDEDEDVA
ncbi:ribosome modulation factor [Afipia carboxidovorans]|uniref:ribosome modulation factor n=1 Tax=Afipia carboxidovorans TaxID=40137 RepID=UPI0030D49EBC